MIDAAESILQIISHPSLVTDQFALESAAPPEFMRRTLGENMAGIRMLRVNAQLMYAAGPGVF